MQHLDAAGRAGAAPASPRAHPSAGIALAASLALGVVALAWSAPTLGAQQPQPTKAAATTPPPAAPAVMPPGATEGNWVSPARDYQGTRYSPLNQITVDNVNKLKEVWSYTTGLKDGHEGQPLVVNNVMYVVTPNPNHLVAFDLTKPGPAKLWEFSPKVDPAATGKACCDTVNRGASFADGKIIYNTLDNQTVAVDAKTGKQLWATKLGDVNKGETMTMAAFVVKDKVYVGNSGGEMGVHGWLAALSVKDGHVLWKAYNTGPDDQVKIGPDFKPYYSWMQGKDMGVKSWRGDQWKIGGAAPWGWVTYDPETNLIFYGTSNPGVWNPDMRPGDNLWSTTIFARDADTGMAKWAYSMTPHDMWDFDGVNENIVADLPMNGQTRKVIVHFDRNGYAYTIDRTNGQVLVAAPFQFINWSNGFDMNTGRAKIVQSKMTHQGSLTQDICPSSSGARDQQPAAYSPRTGLFYTPATNICMDYGGVEAKYIAGTPYVGAAVRMFAGPGDNRGEFLAWDAATGKKVWGDKEKYPVWSGALATAGDVVFYGTMDGDFKAVNAKDGKELWKTHFDSGIIGNAMTFIGPDNKQYIAVYEGVGGWLGAIVPGNLSPDDPWAALGAVGAMSDLPKDTKAGGAVHVFALSQ